MKTLKHQTLIYDIDCPLCNIYTSSFIKAKLLDANGRKAYNNLSKEDQLYIDMDRARNEIALVDTKNNSVIYGIDSLLHLLGHSMPWIKHIGNLKPVKFLLKKLYNFISYNRKVIAPHKSSTTETLQCVPDFNLKYRLIYIAFAWCITSVVLFQYSKHLAVMPISSLAFDGLVAFGQMLFQTILIFKKEHKTIWNYVGHLMTVSLIGSLLLIPILVLNLFFELPQIALDGWFGLTVTFMLYEHIRRVKLLQLPKYLSLTWVMYRVLILIVIFNL